MIKIGVFVKFFNGEISPFDESAIECALSVPNAVVTVVTMAPYFVKEKLEYYTRLNLDAVLICDNAYAGSDTLITSRILGSVAKKYNFDLILCGRQSLNGDTAQVPPELAYELGFDFIPYVMDFSLEKVDTRLGEKKVFLPAVMSIEKIKTLRFAKISSCRREVTVIDNNFLKFDTDSVGYKGSPTQVVSTREKEKSNRRFMTADFSDLEKLIENSLQKDNVSHSEPPSKKLSEVYYVSKALKEKADSVGEKTYCLPSNENLDYFCEADFFVKEIKEKNIKTLLFPANLRYRVVAPILASKLGVGLSADCIELNSDGQKLFMIRPALSGNTIATIESKSDVSIATVRVKENSNDVIFCVGYGAKDKIDEIKSLAKKYNAEVVATRKVVDSGLMPYSAQVGLTGRIVSPKVYVAFGVSGAVQHLVGMENSTTVIAINKDNNEKIFDYADYGIIKEI